MSYLCFNYILSYVTYCVNTFCDISIYFFHVT
nr:MAG TPA: hypothetical protein [Caudoviricetes sp.]DAT55293.1 MAG TPA: hypothetical protein [Caudoviricetes sp.]DAU52688.1 MAG TPA: hypothetical protein [Caudoviricetes sp.]